MAHTRRRTTTLAAALGLTLALASGALASRSASDDEDALAPTRGRPSNSIERKIDRLVARMTVEEKLQQVQLLSDGQITDADARAGVGSVFSLVDPEKIDHFQRIAVEESRLGIPVLFAYDTIHGYRTIFPVPLGAASSFDPDVARADAEVGARESAVQGLKQVYSPMVDVSHEPRWGRIVEGAGEDPYLGSVMGAARVKGAQGSDYSAPDKVVSSVKHYVAYGQPEGGRDYNTTDMSESRLRNLYLPPFKAAIDAGADTVMCSFNSINGVPGCANKYTETDILKKEWGFDGFIESDYTAVAELRACPPVRPDEGPCGHGVAADGPQAGAAALMAGTDSEMVSTNIRDYGTELLASRQITMRRLDDAVRRILRVKFRAGLFDNPYIDVGAAADPASYGRPEDLEKSRWAAGRSMVLLKNDDGALPLDPERSTALIGPFGDNVDDVLGPWSGRGSDDLAPDHVPLVAGLRAASSAEVTYTQACNLAHNFDPPNNANPPLTPEEEVCAGPGADGTTIEDAVAAAEAADQVVLALGENAFMSGESNARSELDLPGAQEELIDAVAQTGKPLVVVLFNGRPLDLSAVQGKASAILEAWFPGTQGGNAVADVLFGTVNPGGKLPVSFPRRVGTVPYYYNHEPTGRPCDPTFKWNSRYRDLDTCAPLYPFGYGLSYTTFEVTGLSLSRSTVRRTGSLTASMRVRNTGSVAGDDVVQLYLHDPVASLSQPVRRLRGFQRVSLEPGQSTTVSFTLDKSDFGFWDNQGTYVVEPGLIEVYGGDSSTATMKQTFTVTR
ncbi:glycoside hydrolase [Nocardioides sp. Root122]|uniref:beta-glucosidase BglX n=1 Tax=Nocardioides TaxID=1839 RepID=UPI0007029F63|nr:MULTISPECIES: beta-glucosidase BglX [Nocardioides]KQV67572.1 glycoside hydrolase [Nocardioides sp. Root122]MCK9824919.1 beta-glucosidase BglX [Nocardioides cavernae]